MKRRLFHRLVPTLFLALIACGGGSERIVANAALVQLQPDETVQMNDATLTFPLPGHQDLLAKQPGDILVSADGNGFLRKVVSVAQVGDTIVLQTETVGLDEVVLDGEFANSAVGVSGKSDWLGPGLDDVNVSFDNASIYGLANAEVKVLSGNLTFHPNLDVGLKISGGALQQFSLVAAGEVDAALQVQVTAHGTVGGSVERQLWSSPPRPFVQWIGWFPVVEVVTISTGVGVSANIQSDTTLTLGATAQANVTAGIRFQDGAWHLVGDSRINFTPTATAAGGDDGTSSVDVYAYVRVDVMFYNLAGPYLGVYPYVGIDSTDGNAGGHWGTAALTGGSLTFLKKNALEIDYNLLEFYCPFGNDAADCKSADPSSHPIFAPAHGHAGHAQ